MARGDPGLFDDHGVRRAFLARLAKGDSVLAACRAVKIQPSSAYEARRCIAGFAEAWDARKPPQASQQRVPLVGGRGGWHAKFLDHFRESANVVQAARAAGVRPATVYRQRTVDADFNLACIHARAQASDMIEDGLMSQCIHGFDETAARDGVTVRIRGLRPDRMLRTLDRIDARRPVQRRGPRGLPASIPMPRPGMPVYYKS